MAKGAKKHGYPEFFRPPKKASVKMSKRAPSLVDLAHRTAVTGLVGLGVSRTSACLLSAPRRSLVPTLFIAPTILTGPVYILSSGLDLGTLAHSGCVEVSSR